MLITIAPLIITYGIRMVFFDDYNLQKVYHHFIELFIINFIITQLIEFYFYFVKEKNEQLELALQKNELLSLQYKILQERVNPHFLFNSLNVLSALVYQDADRANKYTKELSKLYRYVLNANQFSTIKLSDELKFLDSYLYILNLRFNHSIHLEISKPNDFKDQYIVPLTLQLLVENAIKHNSFNHSQPLHIEVNISSSGIEIKNNLKPITSKDSGTKLGLQYIKTTYEKQDLPIQITMTNTEFVVVIPHLKKSHHESSYH